MNSSIEEEIEEELEDETVESEKEEESEEEVESEDESEEVEEEDEEEEEEGESEEEEEESEEEESESAQEQTTESEAEPAKKPEANKPTTAPKESKSTSAAPEASDKDDNPYIDDSFEDFSDLDSSADKANSKKTEPESKPLKSSTAAPSTLTITSTTVPSQAPLTAKTSAPKIVHNESSASSSTSNQIQPSQIPPSTVASSVSTTQPSRTADFKGEGMGVMYSKGSFTWIDPEMEIQHSNHSSLHKFFSAENEQLYSELVEVIEENERKAMEERWLNREVDVSHEVKDMFSTVNRTNQVTDEVVQTLVVSALLKQLQQEDPKLFRDTVASQSDSVPFTQHQQTIVPISQSHPRVHSTRSRRNKSTIVEDKFQDVLEEMGKKKELPAIGNIARIIRKETPGTDAVTDTVINSLIKEALNEILQDEMIVSIIKDAVKLKLKKILKII